MDREYFGVFINKFLKQDCRVVLDNDTISLYLSGKNGVKFREFKAESIFSFEDERLIKINKPVNLSLEVLLSFFGSLLLPFNFFLGLTIIGLSFLSALRKPSKSYVLLCKPISKQKAQLRLLKISGIKSKPKKTIFKAA